MSKDFDEQLRARLHRLEAELPADRDRRRRRSMPGTAIALGVAAILGIATGAAGASVVFRDASGGAPGVFSPDGPLYCSSVHQMSPVDADRALQALGYEVVWQLEDRDNSTSTQTAAPPEGGFIVEGALVNGELILVVERGEGVEPVPDPCP